MQRSIGLLTCALAAALLCPATARAQALRMVTYHEQLDGGPVAPYWIGHVPVTLVSGRRSCRAQSNAIRIGADRALTVAHCLEKRGWRLRRVLVGGMPARIVYMDDTLALLAVSGLDGPVAIVPTEWTAAHPSDGDRLTHRWTDPRTGAMRTRTVTWRLPVLVEGFEPGMSGSGVYDARGVLVAVAEWTTGFAWTPLDLAAFVERAALVSSRPPQ